MASEVDISGGAMHIGSAFRAEGVSDSDDVSVRRCPACSTGVATYAEQAGVMVMHCSTGCTPEQVLKALHDARTATFPLRLPVMFSPPADTDTQE